MFGYIAKWLPISLLTVLSVEHFSDQDQHVTTYVAVAMGLGLSEHRASNFL